MQLTIAPEHRAIIDNLKVVVVTDVPDNTPAHIRMRLQAGIAAFCERRSITGTEFHDYQTAATRFAATRPQVTVKRTAAPVTRTAATTSIDRRHGALALKYKALDYETIKRAVKFNYGEDTLNSLNLAAIGKKLGR
jgi:hypothetical protein